MRSERDLEEVGIRAVPAETIVPTAVLTGDPEVVEPRTPSAELEDGNRGVSCR